jgi:hypothetical protein
MSSHVVGFRPPDEKWQQMKKIWDACEAAGVNPPYEVTEFFNDCAPDPAGVEVGILHSEWRSSTSAEGYEVDIRKLPKDVTVIRFFNSW